MEKICSEAHVGYALGVAWDHTLPVRHPSDDVEPTAPLHLPIIPNTA